MIRYIKLDVEMQSTTTYSIPSSTTQESTSLVLRSSDHIEMTSSPLLDSFDPFATHPFTNSSGVIPRPPSPSIYPLPVPSTFRLSDFGINQAQIPTSSESPSLKKPSSTESTTQYPDFSSWVHTPQPKRYHTPLRSPEAPTSPLQHIFVPFRKDASSPDLVLKKKSTAVASNPNTPRK